MKARTLFPVVISAVLVAAGIAMILLGRHLLIAHPEAIHDLQASFQMFALLAFGGFTLCIGFVLLLSD